MSRFKQCIQVGRNINDVFGLPCVYGCHKFTGIVPDGERYIFLVNVYSSQREISKVAYIGDWLCEDYDGRWHVLSDEEYRKEVGDE